MDRFFFFLVSREQWVYRPIYGWTWERPQRATRVRRGFGVPVAEELTRCSGRSHEAQRKPGGPIGAGEVRHGLRRVTDVSPGLRWDEGRG